jgi:hypothetical protein
LAVLFRAFARPLISSLLPPGCRVPLRYLLEHRSHLCAEWFAAIGSDYAATWIANLLTLLFLTVESEQVPSGVPKSLPTPNVGVPDSGLSVGKWLHRLRRTLRVSSFTNGGSRKQFQRSTCQEWTSEDFRQKYLIPFLDSRGVPTSHQ